MTFILWGNETGIFLSQFCSGDIRKGTLTIFYDRNEQKDTEKKEDLFFVSFFVPEKEESVENKKERKPMYFQYGDWQNGRTSV